MQLAIVMVVVGFLACYTEVAHGNCKLADGSDGGNGCVTCLENNFWVCSRGRWIKRPCGPGTYCQLTGHCQATCGN